MNTFIQSLPFVAAISLLAAGVVKLRRFLFIVSFVVLIGACAFTFVADGSSAAFSLMGGFVLVFGLVCVALSRSVKPGGFVSRDGLGAIGALFLLLGLAGLMIV